MSDPLFSKPLLRLAADANGAGRLADPHVTGHAFNPACGDRVSIELVLADNQIAEIAHETSACLLAQASASILGRALRKATLHDVKALHASVRAMLESESPPPPPPFDAYVVFKGAVEYQSRHRCVLLPIDAVLHALENADSK